MQALAAGLGVALPEVDSAPWVAGWRSALHSYLESLARPDGGYAWADQDEAHLTPTFAVVGCYRALGQFPPNKGRLAEFVRSHHPARLKKLEQERRAFEFQQVQSLVWLGEDVTGIADRIRSWTEPLDYMKAYEKVGNPLFQSELAAIRCRELLGFPMDDLVPRFKDFLDARRRANGTFNSAPTSDGGDGHVMNTWWGLRAWVAMGRQLETGNETTAWLRACQVPSGGFTYHPKPDFGGVDDVAYTWAAVRALKLLGSAPLNCDACVAWLWSLANEDGGFADRNGWLSNPMATYYALDALDALAALPNPPARLGRPARRGATLPADLKVFSLQIEAHGQGSPAEAVELARGLRLHLWGAKNAKPEWIARAQSLADEQKVPLRFFVANEEYGTWVRIPGLGTYSHTSDIIAPTGAAIGESLANRGTVSWPEYREKRLAPLAKGSGRLIWQFGENEELVRVLLDDSVERGGFAAISTFHFGNPDFTNSEPFLHRWRGKIPYVALQDAHGPEPWWFADVTSGCRTVFLATEPTWEAWLNALQNNWVVAIRHDDLSRGKLWMHSGSREVLDFVKARERDWRWWGNPDIQRPMVSIVALRPEDRFEVAHPSDGVALRVRCAWECTAHGLLKKPLAELLAFSVDGTATSLKLISLKKSNGLLEDHYHYLPLKHLAAGPHTATAVVRILETQAEVSRTVTFAV